MNSIEYAMLILYFVEKPFIKVKTALVKLRRFSLVSYIYPLHIYTKSWISGPITHSPMCHFFHITYCTSKIFNRQEFIHFFFMNPSKTFNVKKNLHLIKQPYVAMFLE